MRTILTKLNATLLTDQSLGIAGLSESGKTTFCQTIGTHTGVFTEIRVRLAETGVLRVKDAALTKILNVLGVMEEVITRK